MVQNKVSCWYSSNLLGFLAAGALTSACGATWTSAAAPPSVTRPWLASSRGCPPPWTSPGRLLPRGSCTACSHACQVGSTALTQVGSTALSHSGREHSPHLGRSALTHSGREHSPHLGREHKKRESGSDLIGAQVGNTALIQVGNTTLIQVGNTALSQVGNTALIQVGNTALSHSGREHSPHSAREHSPQSPPPDGVLCGGGSPCRCPVGVPLTVSCGVVLWVGCRAAGAACGGPAVVRPVGAGLPHAALPPAAGPALV